MYYFQTDWISLVWFSQLLVASNFSETKQIKEKKNYSPLLSHIFSAPKHQASTHTLVLTFFLEFTGENKRGLPIQYQELSQNNLYIIIFNILRFGFSRVSVCVGHRNPNWNFGHGLGLFRSVFPVFLPYSFLILIATYPIIISPIKKQI